MSNTPGQRGNSSSVDHLRGKIVDASGRTLNVLVADAEHFAIALSDGSQLLVPYALLEQREDESFVLPVGLQPDGHARIDVIEERPVVSKRMRESGGVRIDKTVRVEDEPIEVDLLREELTVERIAVDAVVDERNVPGMREEGDTVIIPVLEERLVLHKQLVLKEELHIKRLRTQHTERRTEPLRKEHLTVTPLPQEKKES